MVGELNGFEQCELLRRNLVWLDKDRGSKEMAFHSYELVNEPSNDACIQFCNHRAYRNSFSLQNEPLSDFLNFHSWRQRNYNLDMDMKTGDFGQKR